MIDINLLRVMKHRDTYFKIKNRVPKKSLNEQTYALLTDFGKYFERFPENTQIDIPVFLTLFRTWHPKLPPEHITAYEKIIKNCEVDVPEDDQSGIVQSLLELRLNHELLDVVTKFEEGELENIHGAIESLMEDFRRDAKVQSLSFLQDKIGDLLKDEIDESGLRWRLECLNLSMRGLRPGDFILIAGRPDKGKTTLLASELTYMAEQMPGERTVVWLNNEGPGRRIITRLYQATLGIPMSELVSRYQEGVLEDQYNTAMGMPWRIRVFDIHGMDTYAVERIIEQNNAGIVVYDMIDNIRGFGDATRTDLGLEKMYQWARELCVKYDCIGIATSQISNEGDGLQFPTLPMLKDSKTGKQGAVDVQLMIGSSNDPGLAGVRYISLPKNKLRREGGLADPRATVKYQPELARYTDIPTTTEE